MGRLRKAILLATAGLIIICKGSALPQHSLPAQDDRINVTLALGAFLSPFASVSTNLSLAPRWSDYHAPRAGVLVNVATDTDVAETIRFCNQHNLRFLAQNGGNGWADTWTLGEEDVIIDLRGLNEVAVSEDRTRVEFGGGVSNDELIQAAYEAGVEVCKSWLCL